MRGIPGSVWIAALLALGVSGKTSAVTLAFNPSSASVGVGSMTSIDVVIAGLGDGAGPSVGTYDIDVSYDAGRLDLSALIFGAGLDVLGLGSVQSSDDSVPGVINVYELSLDLESDLNAMQAASFTLFTLIFEGSSPGSSALGLSINALGDAIGNALTAQVSPGTIRIDGSTSVPEPGSLALLALGLAGLGWTWRRQLKFEN